MSHPNPNHDRSNEYSEDTAHKDGHSSFSKKTIKQTPDLLKHIGGKVGKSAEKAKKMAKKSPVSEDTRARAYMHDKSKGNFR